MPIHKILVGCCARPQVVETSTGQQEQEASLGAYRIKSCNSRVVSRTATASQQNCCASTTTFAVGTLAELLSATQALHLLQATPCYVTYKAATDDGSFVAVRLAVGDAAMGTGNQVGRQLRAHQHVCRSATTVCTLSMEDLDPHTYLKCRDSFKYRRRDYENIVASQHAPPKAETRSSRITIDLATSPTMSGVQPLSRADATWGVGCSPTPAAVGTGSLDPAGASSFAMEGSSNVLANAVVSSTCQPQHTKLHLNSGRRGSTFLSSLTKPRLPFTKHFHSSKHSCVAALSLPNPSAAPPNAATPAAPSPGTDVNLGVCHSTPPSSAVPPATTAYTANIALSSPGIQPAARIKGVITAAGSGDASVSCSARACQSSRRAVFIAPLTARGAAGGGACGGTTSSTDICLETAAPYTCPPSLVLTPELARSAFSATTAANAIPVATPALSIHPHRPQTLSAFLTGTTGAPLGGDEPHIPDQMGGPGAVGVMVISGATLGAACEVLAPSGPSLWCALPGQGGEGSEPAATGGLQGSGPPQAHQVHGEGHDARVVPQGQLNRRGAKPGSTSQPQIGGVGDDAGGGGGPATDHAGLRGGVPGGGIPDEAGVRMVLQWLKSIGARAGKRLTILVTEWCDQGTLQQILQQPQRRLSHSLRDVAAVLSTPPAFLTTNTVFPEQSSCALELGWLPSYSRRLQPPPVTVAVAGTSTPVPVAIDPDFSRGPSGPCTELKVTNPRRSVTLGSVGLTCSWKQPSAWTSTGYTSMEVSQPPRASGAAAAVLHGTMSSAAGADCGAGSFRATSSSAAVAAAVGGALAPGVGSGVMKLSSGMWRSFARRAAQVAALRCALQVAQGVRYLHDSGFYHANLNPTTIWCCQLAPRPATGPNPSLPAARELSCPPGTAPSTASGAAAIADGEARNTSAMVATVLEILVSGSPLGRVICKVSSNPLFPVATPAAAESATPQACTARASEPRTSPCVAIPAPNQAPAVTNHDSRVSAGAEANIPQPAGSAFSTEPDGRRCNDTDMCTSAVACPAGATRGTAPAEQRSACSWTGGASPASGAASAGGMLGCQPSLMTGADPVRNAFAASSADVGTCQPCFELSLNTVQWGALAYVAPEVVLGVGCSTPLGDSGEASTSDPGPNSGEGILNTPASAAAAGGCGCGGRDLNSGPDPAEVAIGAESGMQLPAPTTSNEAAASNPPPQSAQPQQGSEPVPGPKDRTAAASLPVQVQAPVPSQPGFAPGPCANVFTFGMILHLLMTGRTPHYDLHPAQILVGKATGDLDQLLEWPQELDEEVRVLGQACLLRDPALRPSMRQAEEVLAAALERATCELRDTLHSSGAVGGAMAAWVGR